MILLPQFVYRLLTSILFLPGACLKTLPSSILLCALISYSLPLCPAAECQQNAPEISALTAENRPFTPALQVGDTLYLSGHLGVDRATGKPSSNPSEEATQVLRSVRASLEQAGMTMDDLVYVEVFCTDLSLYSVFNKEYVSYFHKPYPARDFIGAKDLLFGAHFEVMGIAVRHAAENKKPAPSAP